ncbi:MAG: hypothetical protein ACRCTY_03885, partial [Candidatus Adiutrix sp.]
SAGLPAIAASMGRSHDPPWAVAVHIIIGVIDSYSTWSIPRGVALNLNIPPKLTTGRNHWFWTFPHPTPSNDYYEGHPHPDGSINYTRLRGHEGTSGQLSENSDLAHDALGHITLSPITPHGYHSATLNRLRAENS